MTVNGPGRAAAKIIPTELVSGALTSVLTTESLEAMRRERAARRSSKQTDHQDLNLLPSPAPLPEPISAAAEESVLSEQTPKEIVLSEQTPIPEMIDPLDTALADPSVSAMVDSPASARQDVSASATRDYCRSSSSLLTTASEEVPKWLERGRDSLKEQLGLIEQFLDCKGLWDAIKRICQMDHDRSSRRTQS